jgi:group I intron endonuclease
MTKTGIYKLIFISGKYYIGQSLNLAARHKEHVRSLSTETHFNYKVQEQFNKFGYPEFIILQNCAIKDLSELETKYIDLKDPNCLNIINGSPNQFIGENSPRAIYTDKLILEVMEYMAVNPKVSKLDISKKFGIDKCTIYDLSSIRGRALTFMDTHPGLIQNIQNNMAKNTRGINTVTLTNGRETVTLVSGEYTEFCINYGIQNSNLSKVINGSRKTTMGWRLVENVKNF